jgi:putative hemolysin
MEKIAVVLICLILNALFAAYEMAFVAVSKASLRKLSREGNKVAKRLQTLRDSPERTLSVIQIGITLVGAVAAAIGGVGATDTLVPYFMDSLTLNQTSAEVIAVVLVVLPITYLNVVVGELVPKSLALRNPTKIVLRGAKWLFIFDRLLSPVVTALEWSTKKILKNILHKSQPAEVSMNSIEIESFSPAHQKFIINMVEIEKKRIKDVMIPWDKVNHVKHTDDLNTVLQVVLHSGHTRLPVVDNGYVLGILHTKEFVALKESGELNWQGIVRPAVNVHSNDAALRVLRMMQEKRNHMFIVTSTIAERVGIVTLEDIIEEIVGDIFDEDDDGTVRRIFASRARRKLSLR